MPSTSRLFFATPLWESTLANEALLAELGESIRALSEDDTAGRAWSRAHGYKGYTSYASLNDLPTRDPAFADLARHLRSNAARFAKELGWATKPKLDSLWVNRLKPGGHHAGHIHPHSILSGTLYVEAPEQSGAIRFEDPRLPLMMAAPVRQKDAPEHLASFVSITPRPGLLLMWESWLRHEVLAGKAERLSISFNFS